MATNYWLMKSEPGTYSIDDLARDKKTSWDGIRNYQARNHLRATAVGDQVLFYHSSAEPTGVAGIAEVVKAAYPDPKDDEWSVVDLKFVEKFPRVVELQELKEEAALEGMIVTKKGSRLSVSPVSAAHFELIKKMAKKKV